ncbi:MAG: trypsin-like peptidase domain-containing protein [Patescibacteria group bacterium]|nr:trypsin-like peptidase domain-containing protein [Patescibacteria group bacterium]
MKEIKIIPFIFFLLLMIGMFWGYFKLKKFDQRISNIEQKLSISDENIDELTINLEKQSSELERREIVIQKSQDSLLTEAVAEIAPAVVSVVVTKDVPLLEVTYVNPFGNDPFFKDFGFRIPQYKQKGTEKQEVGSGTGFIVHQDGFIITNRHVVKDSEANFTALLSNGQQKQAYVIYKDENIDMAILKIEGKFNYIDLGKSSSLRLGQSVFAIGNALGEYNNSVSVGIISGLERIVSFPDGTQMKNIIQTDAAINPGNSGGPLIDLNGKVIGVNVATTIGAENIGFAIPIDEIKKIIKDIIPF